MRDKINEEYQHMIKKRSEMRQDLIKYQNVLSRHSIAALRIELASVDSDIVSMRKEMDDMAFDELIKNAWGKQHGV